MPYASQADMTGRFGAPEIRQLTDRELPLAGAIVPAVLDRALNDADGVINRMLGGRFAVPLPGDNLPADLVRVACDIARYMLHDLSPPEAVRQHYEDALAWLRLVADGKLPLVGTDGGLIGSRQAATSFSTCAVAAYPAGGSFGQAFSERWISGVGLL